MSAPAQSPEGAAAPPASIKMVSHSMLLYWWPVWAVGLILGFVSLVDGRRLAIVPEGTKLRAGADTGQEKTFELIVPARRADALRELAEHPDEDPFPVRVAASKNLGLLFCFVALAVILSTNIPLRGLWSVVVFLGVLLIAVIFAGLDLWAPILGALGRLHIYITAVGYLFLSSVLLVVWLVTVFIFDQKRYVIFTAGQIVVHQEVGDLRQVYDTGNVVVQKLRSDFFRHVLLGFYSGDVLVHVPGAQNPVVLLPNVLFATWKVEQAANLMKTRPIIMSAPQ
jgi:hypothetical protein